MLCHVLLFGIQREKMTSSRPLPLQPIGRQDRRDSKSWFQ